MFPVTPQKAVVFIEETGKNSIINSGIVNLYTIDNTDDLLIFNKAAFSTQCAHGNGYVVSPQKEPLEMMLHKERQDNIT